MRFSRLVPQVLFLTLLLTGATGSYASSLVLGSSDFHYSNGSTAATFDRFDGGWRVGNNAGQERLIAAVKLPQDATVNSFTMYYLDNSTGLIECNLLRALITASDHPGSNVLAALGSTEQDTSDHSKTDATIDNAVIDNTAYYYFVYVGMANSDGERKFLAAVIDYTDPVTAVGDQPTLSAGRAQAHPNPFRLGTSIEFSMQSEGPVSVDIYDIQGRLVRAIREAYLPAGNQSLSWNGLDDFGKATPSGVYFAQVKSRNEALAAKLVRVR